MPVEIGCAIISPNGSALSQGNLRSIYSRAGRLPPGGVAGPHGRLLGTPSRHELRYEFCVAVFGQVGFEQRQRRPRTTKYQQSGVTGAVRVAVRCETKTHAPSGCECLHRGQAPADRVCRR